MFNTNEVKPLPMDSMAPDHNASKWLIEREPMLFQSSVEFAYNAGGPITKGVLDHLRAVISQKEFDRVRIDTRSHMLMPGFYPCIPGWHSDFLETNPDGTQKFNDFDGDINHYMYLSGPPSTEFIRQRDVFIPNYIINEQSFTWGDVSSFINSQPLDCYKIGTGQLIKFNARELHRGTPHTGDAGHWRFFFRATSLPEDHKDFGKYFNKIRSQVQVYCDLNKGW